MSRTHECATIFALHRPSNSNFTVSLITRQKKKKKTPRVVHGNLQEMHGWTGALTLYRRNRKMKRKITQGSKRER